MIIKKIKKLSNTIISHDLPVGRVGRKLLLFGTQAFTRKACEHDGVISKDPMSARHALVLARDSASHKVLPASVKG
jgi:hypothetical protein